MHNIKGLLLIGFLSASLTTSAIAADEIEIEAGFIPSERMPLPKNYVRTNIQGQIFKDK